MAEISNMLGVPSVNPAAAPNVMQNVQPTADKGLGDIGAAATGLGKVFGQVQVDDVTNNVMAQARQITDHFQSLSGQDALNAQASTQEALNKVFSEGGSQLGSIDQQVQYNQTTRTYQDRYFGGMIAQHAAQAGRDYQDQVNNTTYKSGLDQIASNPNDPNNFQLGFNMVLGASVKNLQAQGNEGDPALMQAAVANATKDAWKVRLQSIGATDPAAAYKLAQTNQKALGTDYASISQDLETRANTQVGQTASDSILNNLLVGGSAPAAPPSAAQPGVQPVNNPMNLRPPGAKTGFMQFPSAQAGLDAGMAQLKLDVTPVQQGGHGLNTIASLIGDPIHGWAPASENATSSYVQNVSQAVGILPNAPISAADLPAIQQAIVKQEGGGSVALPSGPDFAGIRQQGTQQILASDMTDAQKQAAVTHFDSTLTAQEVAYNSSVTASKAQSQAAASQIATQIWTLQDQGKPIPADTVQQIDSLPLDFDTKKSLREIALQASGQNQTVGYGTGYTDTFNKILAPYGTPGKISDPSQVLALQASGQLTSSGAKDLMGTLADTQRGVAGQGVAAVKAGLLNYAKSKLVFEDPLAVAGISGADIPGMPQIKDPNGQAIYDTKFIPAFEASWGAWVKAGNDPMKYPVDQINKMAAQLRPAGQMAADQMTAVQNSDLPGGSAPAIPALPVPANVVNQNQWNTYVQHPPNTSNGPMDPTKWYEYLHILMENPQQNAPYFNQRFATFGYDGNEIAQQLTAAPVPEAHVTGRGSFSAGSRE